ncbi:MAG: hypothetical protein JSV41_03005, partial [Gemmatimonadota bacterium]
MTLPRRTVLKMGLAVGATPLLARLPLIPQETDHGLGTVEGQLLQARPLPLNSVRLLGGPLKHAQDLNARYLLRLEPDRMLAYYRERA